MPEREPEPDRDPQPDQDPLPRRRRRRAVGPPGARPECDSSLEALATDSPAPATEADDHLRREVPPHHGD